MSSKQHSINQEYQILVSSSYDMGSTQGFGVLESLKIYFFAIFLLRENL